MTETQYTAQIRARYEDLGFLVHKVSDRFAKGRPDLTVWGKQTFAIEVKVDDNPLDPLQEQTLKDIAAVGGFAFVMHRSKEGHETVVPYGRYDCTFSEGSETEGPVVVEVLTNTGGGDE